jgi:hypothetical protein
MLGLLAGFSAVHAALHAVVHVAVHIAVQAVMHAAVYAVVHAGVHAAVIHPSHCSDLPDAQLPRQSALSGAQPFRGSAQLWHFLAIDRCGAESWHYPPLALSRLCWPTTQSESRHCGHLRHSTLSTARSLQRGAVLACCCPGAQRHLLVYARTLDALWRLQRSTGQSLHSGVRVPSARPIRLSSSRFPAWARLL